MSRYRLHAAAIDGCGLQLSSAPKAYAKTLRAALVAADDEKNHGPEGVAIVTPRGRTIYTAAEYDAARRRVQAQEGR